MSVYMNTKTITIDDGQILMITECGGGYDATSNTVELFIKFHLVPSEVFERNPEIDDTSVGEDRYDTLVQEAKKYPCYYALLVDVSEDVLNTQDRLTNGNSGLVVNNGLLVVTGGYEMVVFDEELVSTDYKLNEGVSGKKFVHAEYRHRYSEDLRFEDVPIFTAPIIHTDNKEALALGPLIVNHAD